MNASSFIGLVNNAALLLALGLLYEMMGTRLRGRAPLVQQLLTGAFLGAIGIAIMVNPWEFRPGVLFDTRSVLLCISGLFFGAVPVSLAVLVTGAFRLSMGGAGAWAGVAVIVTSGGIGLAWRHLRCPKKKAPEGIELYGLGLVVHATMLACMFLMPWETALRVLAKIGLPVMLIHPFTTAVLGKLMVNREKHRQAEAALKKSEAKFRNIFRHHAAVKLLIDPDTGRIVEANLAAEKFYGWSLEKLGSMRIQDINTLLPAQIQAEMVSARNRQCTFFEFRHRLADGSVKDVEVYSSRIEIDGNAFLHSIIHDVTARKRAEAARREQERFLRSIIQTTADGFWVTDREGRVTDVNDAYCAMSGYGREEVIGMGIGDLEADRGDKAAAARRERIITGRSEIYRTYHRRKDGSLMPVEISATYLEDGGGKFVCFGRDLTARKQQEERVALLGRMLDAAPAAIMIHDTGGRLLFVNDAAYTLHGYGDKEAFLAVNLRDLEVPESAALLPQRLSCIAANGETRFEVAHYRKDGSTIPLDILAKSIDWEGRPAVLSIGTDISARKAAEETLREHEEYQRAMIAASPVAIVSLTPDGRVRSWNTAAERIFGWSEAEVLGRPLPSGPEDQHEVFAALSRRVMDGEGFSNVELTRRHRNGQMVEISLSTAPIRDRDGRVTAIMAVCEDITERKRAEKERDKLQAQLIQAQKMESVGRLAGGVAHDYNNMLSVILGYTELALDKLDAGDALRPDLEEILVAARRSAEITRQLLAFSRQQTIAPQRLDLNDTVEKMLKMLRRLIGEDIDLAWYPGGRLWPVYMDPSQLDQILVNLCVNARDAIADVGQVTIETDTRTFDQTYCADHQGFVPGDFVMLSVSDDGCGIDEDLQPYLFEPFFTTKDKDRGTGLGLATVYGIVKQNHGFINVYSEPGQGTTFRIYIPRHEAAAEPVQKQAKAVPEARGSETILLVEDEQTILKMTTTMLQRLGYSVLTAGTPDQALALATAHAGRIHLLMTDVVMPDMNGRELATRLQELHPDLGVLFMSGYTANVIAHRGVLYAGIHFIQKPFSKKELAPKIREALEQPAGPGPS